MILKNTFTGGKVSFRTYRDIRYTWPNGQGGEPVTGMDAITANNGWAMAVTGAIIVMCGLSILSFLISQLHKIIALFEKKPQAPTPRPSAAASEKPGLLILDDMAATARIYQSISACLGEKFELTKLYQMFNKESLPHPHLTIRTLRESGYLYPAGDGLFSWKTD